MRESPQLPAGGSVHYYGKIALMLFQYAILAHVWQGAASLSNSAVMPREYLLLQGFLQRLQFLGACHKLFEFALDRGVADVLVREDSVGINRESVGNGLYAK